MEYLIINAAFQNVTWVRAKGPHFPGETKTFDSCSERGGPSIATSGKLRAKLSTKQQAELFRRRGLFMRNYGSNTWKCDASTTNDSLPHCRLRNKSWSKAEGNNAEQCIKLHKCDGLNPKLVLVRTRDAPWLVSTVARETDCMAREKESRALFLSCLPLLSKFVLLVFR